MLREIIIVRIKLQSPTTRVGLKKLKMSSLNRLAVLKNWLVRRPYSRVVGKKNTIHEIVVALPGL